MNKTLKVTLITLGSVFGVWLAMALVAFFLNMATQNSSASDDPEFTGITIQRGTYMKSCLQGAAEENTDGTFTQQQMDDYCGCTYDKGIAQYGDEQFYKQLKGMNDSGEFTSEFNTIVNECVQEQLL
jgi:hypothetical protein